MDLAMDIQELLWEEVEVEVAMEVVIINSNPLLERHTDV